MLDALDLHITRADLQEILLVFITAVFKHSIICIRRSYRDLLWDT